MVWGQQGMLESVRCDMEERECGRLTDCGGGADAEGDVQGV